MQNMSAAAAILIRQRRMIRRYRDAGAIDSLHACCPEDLGLRRSWLFNRMIDRGVFVPVGDGRCFLDLQGAQRFREIQRRRAGVLLIVAIVLFLLFA